MIKKTSVILLSSKKDFIVNKIDLPKVSMIAIGDELLNGRTKDLNAFWLGKFLFNKGLNLISMTFVPDDETKLFQTLEASMKEADIIITSGGIGPTLDDKTKKILAQYFKETLNDSPEARLITQKNYDRYNRQWKPEHNFYHMFPTNFTPINNPQGFAPGLFHKTKDNILVFSAPGVPREFRAMVEEEFYPIIQNQLDKRILTNYQSVIRTFGVPEEKIFFELCPTLWDDLEVFGKVSSLPHTLGIDIVVTHNTHNLEEYKKLDLEIIEIFKQSNIRDNIWQFGNLSINELLITKAKEKKLTFGFAESCTGGLCSSKITDVDGSSDVFWGSVISYDNSVKENVIAVSNSTLRKFGAVSVETAKEMALGLREKIKCDIAISITGIAGPHGGSDEKPVGTVCIGLSTKDKTEALKYNFRGDRLRLKDQFSDRALLVLLQSLI